MNGGPLNNVTEQDLETGYGGQMSRPEDLLAFPQPDRPYARPKEELGMTLRDWFAGQALAGICANYGDRCMRGENDGSGWAGECYHLADMMLAESSKPTIEPETEPVEVPEHPTFGPLPFTPRAKKAMELSKDSALKLGHEYLGTEHILLGVARENEGIAAQVLMGLGITSEKIEEQIRKIVKVNP